jgi:ATP-dependent RNA helicase DDX56/DBP9
MQLELHLMPHDRYHTVQEFNKGVYDYIIATDEGGASEEPQSDAEDAELQEGPQQGYPEEPQEECKPCSLMVFLATDIPR